MIHDGGVMIKNTSTMDWQFGAARSIHPSRTHLSKAIKRHVLSQHAGIDNERILSGIDFRKGGRRYSPQTSPPSSQPKTLRKSNDQAPDTEPWWLSLLGGCGLMLGFLLMWILA